MGGREQEYETLRREIGDLRDEIDELRRMVTIVAIGVALIEGGQNVTQTYLLRALAELQGGPLGSLREESFESEELTSKLENGLDLMAWRAREMGLQDLAERLEE